MKENNHIDAKGLFTTKGLEYVFDKGFMHNCYKDASVTNWKNINNISECELWNSNEPVFNWYQEAEVVPFAMKTLDSKSSKFLNENGYKLICENYEYGDNWYLNKRRQASSQRGCYFKAKQDNLIDISADIITSIEKPVKNYLINKGLIKEEEWLKYEPKLKLREITANNNPEHSNLYIFSYIAGTIGNIMLAPEQTNAGWLPDDTWNKKITEISEWINTENHTEKDIDEIMPVRRGAKYKSEIYKKWLCDTQLINNLDTYIHYMFFIDYFEKNNIKKLDDKVIDQEWFLFNSKLIIERGYRIWYSGNREDGISFNDSRPFSQIQSKDSKNEHVIRVRQVIDYLKHIVSNKNTEYSVKTREQYIKDESLNLV